MGKEERVKDYVETVFKVLQEEDGTFKLFLETMTPEKVNKTKERLERYLEKAFENYARSRPLEPNVETVLVFPSWIWSQNLYTKDPLTGILSPIKLVKKEDT